MFTIGWLHCVMTCLTMYVKVVQQCVIELSLFNAQVTLTVDLVPSEL